MKVKDCYIEHEVGVRRGLELIMGMVYVHMLHYSVAYIVIKFEECIITYCYNEHWKN